MISIITVTYNAGPFLERTIKSLIAQQNMQLGTDYEYLIIDGASTDATLTLIQQYEKHLSGWESAPDRGLYDAMNKGLRRATGEYVWFMNAGDELYDPHTLTRLLAAMRDPHTGRADVYYGDALFVRNDGSAVGLRSRVTPHRLPGTLHWQDMALGMRVSHQAFVARRRLAPYYVPDNLSADLDWEIRCLKAAQRTCCLPFVLCRYLVGGLSKQRHARSLFDRFRVLVWHFGLWPTVLNHLRIIARRLVRVGREHQAE